MSVVLPVASVASVTTSVRPPTEKPAAPAVNAVAAATNPNPAPAKPPQPIQYYGGIDGMNATNLIVALLSNGAVSSGYSAQAIETGGTPPPAIVDRAA